MKPENHLDGMTFRWSMKKIRRMSIELGAGTGATIAALVLWDTFFGHTPSINGRLNDAMMGFGLAVAGGFAAAVLVWVALRVGRSCSKTVITAEGLYVQRALWHRNFVRWSDIQSAQFRSINGWRYIYMKTSSTLLNVGLSIELDNLRALETEIARYTLQSNPLRTELSKHVIPQQPQD